MCLVDTQRTFDAGGYGRVSNPDAAGYITPIKPYTPEEEARVRAESEAAAAAWQQQAMPGYDSPFSGAQQADTKIAARTAQAQRDMAFVSANPDYLAKNPQRTAGSTEARRPETMGGGGGGSTLLTGGTASNALTAPKKPRPGAPTLLGG